MTKINSNKLFANTEVDRKDIARNGASFRKTWCEGETDLTTQLRERQEMLVKFLCGLDVTPEQVQEQINRVKFVLPPTVVVWSMEHAQHELARLAAMKSAEGLERSWREGHYCSQHLDIVRAIWENTTT